MVPSRTASVFLLLLMPQISHADDLRTLSMQGAIDLALQQSPLVQRAQRDYAVTAARDVGAALLFPTNPTVSGWVGTRNDRSGSVPLAQGKEWGAHLEQGLEIAGQRGTRRDEVAQAVVAAAARRHFAEQETRARARAAYVATQLAREVVRLTQVHEELATFLLDLSEKRFAAGAAGEIELHVAKVEQGRLRSERLGAALQAAQAEDSLRLMVGAPAGTGVALTTDLTVPVLPQTDVETLVQRAMAFRSDLRALSESAAELDAAIVRLQREAIPNPSIFIDVQRQQPGQIFWGGGLALPLPVWRRNQGDVAVMEAQKARLETETQLARRDIEWEVRRAFREVLQRREQVSSWAEQVIPAANEHVRIARGGWQAGKWDIFRVVYAAREAGDAQQKHTLALGALWQAAIELERTVGTP